MPHVKQAGEGILSMNDPSGYTRDANRTGRPSYGAHSSQIKIKRHTARIIFLAVLTLLIVFLGVCAAFGYQFYKQAMAVKAHEEEAVSLISQVNNDKVMQNPAALSEIISPMQRETAAAKDIVHGDLWEKASKLPKYGDDIKTLQGMVDVIDDASHKSVPILADTAQKLLTAKFSEGNGRINLKPIEDASGGFSEADSVLKQELKALQDLPDPKINKINTVYQQGIEKFKDLSGKIDQANNSIQILPQFLGSNGKRTYVIVAQTPSETRSGGGLIGSMGSMTTDNGQIKVNSFHPNTDFIDLAWGGTPEERAVFSGPLKFSFDIRDLSANPDFSHVAKVVKQRWQLSRYASPVDGVMMIDPVFIQEIIKISGDVKLPGGMTLNGDNTAEYFMNGIYKSVPPNMQDAVFAGVAAQAMNNVFSDLNIQKLLNITKIMEPMAEGRHIYAYSFHPDEAANFQGAGLAKEAPNSEKKPEIGIYLNENNPSKMGWYIHRKTVITRTVCNQDGSQQYHVKFSMTNTIPASDLNSGNSYILGGFAKIGAPGTPVERMLIYGPAGGTIRNFKTGGQATPLSRARLNGKALYTGLATLPPNQTVTYEFDVTTSNKAEDDLRLDQTPMGWSDPNVTYDNNRCSIDR